MTEQRTARATGMVETAATRLGIRIGMLTTRANLPSVAVHTEPPLSVADATEFLITIGANPAPPQHFTAGDDRPFSSVDGVLDGVAIEAFCRFEDAPEAITDPEPGPLAGITQRIFDAGTDTGIEVQSVAVTARDTRPRLVSLHLVDKSTTPEDAARLAVAIGVIDPEQAPRPGHSTVQGRTADDVDVIVFCANGPAS